MGPVTEVLRAVEDPSDETEDEEVPEDVECGAFRFADCPLPMGHAGLCVERDAS